MNDSIDRVFGKGIATVRALSSCGLPRPPAQVRAQLYGLYKQATEGNVAGLVDRPEDLVEQAKWDAWKAVEGLRKSEAKQRYIALLIETMKPYTANAEARELILELEEMWEQLQQHVSQLQSVASSSLPPPTAVTGLGIGGFPLTPTFGRAPSVGASSAAARDAADNHHHRHTGKSGDHAAREAHEAGARRTRRGNKVTTVYGYDGGEVREEEEEEDNGEEMRRWRREVARAMETLNDQVLTLRNQVSELSNEHYARQSQFIRHSVARWVRCATRVAFVVFKHVTIDLVVILVAVALARLVRRSPLTMQRHLPCIPWALARVILLLDRLRENLVYWY
ncbi:hypothetical protein TRVA0_062S00386 [Trichomonascus vanleenenianus]|uniref:uncharacterized protein n=1 Tax=Trichomonascus vanleenenianus TaxID=2268995 RepID=UPI003ECB2721